MPSRLFNAPEGCYFSDIVRGFRCRRLFLRWDYSWRGCPTFSRPEGNLDIVIDHGKDAVPGEVTVEEVLVKAHGGYNPAGIRGQLRRWGHSQDERFRLLVLSPDKIGDHDTGMFERYGDEDISLRPQV